MNHAPGAPLTTPAGVMAPPSGASAGTRLVPSLSTARMGTMVEARALEEKARTAGRRQDWRKDCILGARSRVRGGATNPRRPLSTFDPTSLLLLPAGGNGWVQVLNSPNWALVLGGNSETDRRQLAWTPSRCALASYRRYLLSRSHVRTRGTRLEKNRRISAVRCTLRGIRRSSLPTARAGTPSWVRPPPRTTARTCLGLAGPLCEDFVFALDKLETTPRRRFSRPAQVTLSLSLSRRPFRTDDDNEPRPLWLEARLVLVTKRHPLSHSTKRRLV